LVDVPAHLSVYLSPNPTVSDLPLKSYYRYAGGSPFSFNPDGSLRPTGATFQSLPRSRLLTMAVDTLDSWLVRAAVAKYDTDNILLKDVTDPYLYAQFELQQIMLQGQCSDQAGVPPRGLELYLGREGTPHLQDTLVMSNLGYFQLKANPGVSAVPDESCGRWLIRCFAGLDVAASTRPQQRDLRDRLDAPEGRRRASPEAGGHIRLARQLALDAGEEASRQGERAAPCR
jgi:hypothetical protein